MRFSGRSVLTIFGVLAVLGFLGSVTSAVVAWTSTQTCFPSTRPGHHRVCVTTGPASELTLGPWAYLGLAIGLCVLGVCLFTLRERIRARS